MFGGHDDDDPQDMRWFRRYDHDTGVVENDRMSSPRWEGGRGLGRPRLQSDRGACWAGRRCAWLRAGASVVESCPTGAATTTHRQPQLLTARRRAAHLRRWYPTPCTLPDGRIIVVGGVPDPGDAGYDGITRDKWSNPALDNPTYEVCADRVGGV